MDSSSNSPRGLIRQYSRGCDLKCSKAKEILSLPHFIEYCTFVNFQKDGNGIIRYFDEKDREIYVILGTWKRGKLCGRALLYNMLNDCIESCIFFNNGEFVDEIPLALDNKEFAIIDNSDGYRWEGYIQDGVAVGRGLEFNQTNEKVFSGWYYDNARFGKGECYYDIQSDKRIIQARGMYHSGREFGPFEMFDMKGNYVYEEIRIDGEEVKTQCVLHNPSIIRFSSFTESVSIYSFEGQGIDSVDLSSCNRLKEFIVGDQCFIHTKSFFIRNNPSIEKVIIGRFSFYSHQGTNVNPLPYYEKKRILRDRKTASIRNCCNLQILQIENESFADYIGLELLDLPSLTLCHIGVPSDNPNEWGLNFYWCKSLSFQNLPALQSIKLGNYSFFYCYHCAIDSCKLLESIHIGYGAFSNYEGKEASLLLLERLIIENEALFNCTILNLKKLTALVSSDQITLGPESLYHLKKIRRAAISDSAFSVFYQTRNYHPSVIKTI